MKWKSHTFSPSVTGLEINEQRGILGIMNELMGQGLQLMALGMGVVFLFLGLLITVITLVSRMIQSYEQKTAPAEGDTSSNRDDLLEVISAAVQQYRSDHPRRK